MNQGMGRRMGGYNYANPSYGPSFINTSGSGNNVIDLRNGQDIPSVINTSGSGNSIVKIPYGSNPPYINKSGSGNVIVQGEGGGMQGYQWGMSEFLGGMSEFQRGMQEMERALGGMRIRERPEDYGGRRIREEIEDYPPVREKPMADVTASARASRGLREAPTQRVIFQPDTGSSRARTASSQHQNHTQSPMPQHAGNQTPHHMDAHSAHAMHHNHSSKQLTIIRVKLSKEGERRKEYNP